MTKEALAKVVDKLPDEFDLGELMESLIVMAKIENGGHQLKVANGVPLEEVVNKIKSWSV
jgi:hypothetical protein